HRLSARPRPRVLEPEFSRERFGSARRVTVRCNAVEQREQGVTIAARRGHRAIAARRSDSTAHPQLEHRARFSRIDAERVAAREQLERVVDAFGPERPAPRLHRVETRSLPPTRVRLEGPTARRGTTATTVTLATGGARFVREPRAVRIGTVAARRERVEELERAALGACTQPRRARQGRDELRLARIRSCVLDGLRAHEDSREVALGERRAEAAAADERGRAPAREIRERDARVARRTVDERGAGTE